MNSARPLAPVAALTASVQVFQVEASQGAGGKRLGRLGDDAESAITGVHRPVTTTAHHCAASATFVRLRADGEPERLAAADPERRETIAHGRRRRRSWTSRALRCSSSCLVELRRARARYARSRRGARARRDRATGRTASAEPTSTASDATACGSSPASRRPFSDRWPRRFDSPSPLAVVSRLWCAKTGAARAERLEDLDLHRRVGDVVLAADHVRDGEVDVVDDRRQRVEIGAVLAHQHRVRERAAIDMRRAAHEIGPGDGAMVEPEAPMRAPPLAPRAPTSVLRRERQRGAVVDRRQAAGELALAAELELVRRLVGRHRAGPSPSAARHRVVEREALGLAHDDVGRDAEPGEIRLDRGGEFAASSARGRCRRSAGRRCRPRAARTARSAAPCAHCRYGGAPSATARSGRWAGSCRALLSPLPEGKGRLRAASRMFPTCASWRPNSGTPDWRCGRRSYSIETPLALMGTAHFSISLLTNFAR